MLLHFELAFFGDIKSYLKKKSTYAKFPTSPQHFINKEVTLENRTGWIVRLFCYSASLRGSILTLLKISNRGFL